MMPQGCFRNLSARLRQRVGVLAILVLTAAPVGAEVRLVKGDGENTPRCSAILTPSAHATPDGTRPLRLRLITDTGRDLRLGLLANDDPTRIEVVTGDLRVVFDPIRVETIAETADHPVWPALLAATRLHLTERRDHGTVRTARFDAPNLPGLLDRMAQECGLLLPDAGPDGATSESVEAALRLTGDAVRLVNLAVLVALDDWQDPADVADTLYGAGRDRLEIALRRLGGTPRRYLDKESTDRLFATFGLSVGPAYGDIGDVAGIRLAARIADGWQVIDTAGRALTNPVFRATGPGVAAALPMQAGGGWALFDPSGQRLRHGRSDVMPRCTESGCVVQRGARHQFLAFDNGRLTDLPFDAIGAVSEGWVAVQGGGQWGFAATDGVAGGPMVPARALTKAVDGRAVLTLANSRNRIVSVPDMAMIGPERDAILAMPGGLFAFRSGTLWGLVSPGTGAIHVDPAFKEIGPFARGLAPATTDGTNWGFIDRAGAWRIAPLFASAGPFSNGFARIETARGLHGFVDTSGKLAVPTVFNQARDMSDGHAAVRFGDHWGLLSSALLQRRN